MNKNIKNVDFVVICATPRYIQKDIRSGDVSLGLSEMIHVETGMAIAHGKPVITFIQEGTNIGNVLPNITQYITLNGSKEDFMSKRKLIFSIFNSAFEFVKKVSDENTIKEVKNWTIGGLAVIGGISLLDFLFGE